MRLCKEEGCNESLEGRHPLAKQCTERECYSQREARRNAESREKMKKKHETVRKKEELAARKGVIV